MVLKISFCYKSTICSHCKKNNNNNEEIQVSNKKENKQTRKLTTSEFCQSNTLIYLKKNLKAKVTSSIRDSGYPRKQNAPLESI